MSCEAKSWRTAKQEVFDDDGNSHCESVEVEYEDEFIEEEYTDEEDEYEEVFVEEEVTDSEYASEGEQIEATSDPENEVKEQMEPESNNVVSAESDDALAQDITEPTVESKSNNTDVDYNDKEELARSNYAEESVEPENTVVLPVQNDMPDVSVAESPTESAMGKCDSNEKSDEESGTSKCEVVQNNEAIKPPLDDHGDSTNVSVESEKKIEIVATTIANNDVTAEITTEDIQEKDIPVQEQKVESHHNESQPPEQVSDPVLAMDLSEMAPFSPRKAESSTSCGKKLEWEKPDWAKSSPLKTKKKNVTNTMIGSPEKNIGWEKPAWTQAKLKSTGKDLKKGTDLQAPITHVNKTKEDRDLNREANQHLLKLTTIGEKLKQKGDLQAPITHCEKGMDDINFEANPLILRPTELGSKVRLGENLAMPITFINGKKPSEEL